MSPSPSPSPLPGWKDPNLPRVLPTIPPEEDEENER